MSNFSLSRLTSASMLAFVAYAALFFYSIQSMNRGIFLLTLPLPLAIAFIVTASVTFGVSFELTLERSRLKRATAGMTGSAATFAVGVTVASCTCSAPLVASLLYFIGLNTLEVSGVLVFLDDFQTPIVLILMATNLILCLFLGRRLVS